MLKGHTDEVNAVCWSPGGRYLASCSDDSAAKIWSFDANHTKGVLVHDLKGHSKEIFTLRWTLTGPMSNHPESPLLLCTASFDGTVKVWHGETGKAIYTLGQHTQPVYSVSPSPYGFLLATGSLGGHISVWSLRDGSLVSHTYSTALPLYYCYCIVCMYFIYFCMCICMYGLPPASSGL